MKHILCTILRGAVTEIDELLPLLPADKHAKYHARLQQLTGDLSKLLVDCRTAVGQSVVATPGTGQAAKVPVPSTVD